MHKFQLNQTMNLQFLKENGQIRNYLTLPKSRKSKFQLLRTNYQQFEDYRRIIHIFL